MSRIRVGNVGQFLGSEGVNPTGQDFPIFGQLLRGTKVTFSAGTSKFTL